MCTVTFLPSGITENKEILITHNRDEAINRPALAPTVYSEFGSQIYYPKDIKGGGTWIGYSQQKRLMCFMNGAFEKYKRNPPYRKSRGVVLKELLVVTNLKQTLNEYDFNGIEPFFCVCFSFDDLEVGIFEIVWDGNELHTFEKNAHQPFIWSSAMSYSKEEREIKEKRFQEYLEANGSQHTSDTIWDFHHTKEGEVKGGLIINRGFLKTTSISQLIYQAKGQSEFRYQDLLSDESCREVIDFN